MARHINSRTLRPAGPPNAWFTQGQPFAYAMADAPKKRKGPVKGHHPCPCGSGKKYRKCCSPVRAHKMVKTGGK